MSLGDAGSYYCSGDNGLGHVDKEELILDVQYGPQVTKQKYTHGENNL